MPRMPLTRAPDPPSQPVALVAAATQVMSTLPKTAHQYTHQTWQREAWRHYDICGELRYAASYVGNILSRATLYAAQITPTGAIAVPEGPAHDALQDLFLGSDGQEQVLHALGLHLTIAGECYVIRRTSDGEEISEVVGSEEIRHNGDRWAICYGNNSQIELTDTDVVIRVWRPHPRKRIEADSPVRALLPILTEIEWLTRHVFAQVQSRLAGAGLLTIPQGVTFPTVPGEQGTTADQFIQVLGEAMLRPIADPSSPAATVPTVLMIPDDLVGKIEHITFWSQLDQHAVDLRTEAIRRLALGLEIPPEVLLGTADSNHWSGWIVEESTIKAHIEPLLGLITSALTVGYLRPALGDDKTFLIASETSRMRLRPNRSKEALELYDRGELDGEAVRRETGFTENDRPDDAERVEWLTRKVASGSTTPEQVSAALKALGVDLQVETTSPGTQARPVPTLEQHPTRDIPNAAALHAASEVLVFRSLERAGNRMRSLYGVRPPGVAASDTYRYVPIRNSDIDTVMADAWTCVPRLLGHLNCDTGAIVNALDAYTRSLLTTQEEHNGARMSEFLAAAHGVSA